MGAPPVIIGEYNETMNCQVKDELVSRLVALNNKLNLLSPDLVHGDEERAEVQQQRENLYSEIKHQGEGTRRQTVPSGKTGLGPVISRSLGTQLSAEFASQGIPNSRHQYGSVCSTAHTALESFVALQLSNDCP